MKEKLEGVEEIRRGKEEVERNNNTRKRAAQPDTEVVNLSTCTRLRTSVQCSHMYTSDLKRAGVW